jgi:putative transcriptional regulator
MSSRMADTGPSSSSVAPGFLVAVPSVTGPHFERSLVLMALHSPEGALGLVVSHTAPLTVGQVLSAVDPPLAEVARAAGRADDPVLVGGPVTPERLWILVRAGPLPPPLEEEVMRVGPKVAAGGSRELLDATVRDPERAPYHLVLGYAGWGPLQIENEISRGGWVPMGVDDDLVFEVPFAQRWETAIRRLGLEPGNLTGTRGGAMA